MALISPRLRVVSLVRAICVRSISASAQVLWSVRGGCLRDGSIRRWRRTTLRRWFSDFLQLNQPSRHDEQGPHHGRDCSGSAWPLHERSDGPGETFERTHVPRAYDLLRQAVGRRMTLGLWADIGLAGRGTLLRILQSLKSIYVQPTVALRLTDRSLSAPVWKSTERASSCAAGLIAPISTYPTLRQVSRSGRSVDETGRR